MLLPAEVAMQRRKTEAARAKASRALDRGRIRRLIVPPLAVGSAVLLGSGASIAFADHSVSQASPATTGSSSVAAAEAAQSSAEAAAMAHVRLTLKADQQLIEQLAKAAAAAATANSKSKTVTQQGAAGASSGAAVGGSAAGALPALPALPSMPSVNIPAIPNVSTGATHVP